MAGLALLIYWDGMKDQKDGRRGSDGILAGRGPDRPRRRAGMRGSGTITTATGHAWQWNTADGCIITTTTYKATCWGYLTTR